MSKYIDADKLIAEIHKHIGKYDSMLHEWSIPVVKGKREEAFSILTIIESLQHEQPEGDLEKEIKEHIKECLDVKFPTTDIELIKKDVEYTARKFYELGLNARKEE